MIAVELFISDELSEFHDSARIEVFLPKNDYLLSQMKSAAIERARTFLGACIAVAHPAE